MFFSVFIFIGAIYNDNAPNFNIPYRNLFLSIVLFQIMYSGIYILNDIIDRKSDAQDEFKKSRPLPSGRLPLLWAIVLCTILIILPILVSSLYEHKVLLWLITFTAYNIIYSLILKKIPYIEFLSNGITHSLRLIMGYQLINGDFEGIIIPSLIFYFMITIYSVGKRFVEIERSGSSRNSLKFYNKDTLKMLSAIILLLSAAFCLLQNEKTNYFTFLTFIGSFMGVLGIFDDKLYQITIKKLFSNY